MYNATNIKSVDINELLDYQIIVVGSSNRRPSSKMFRGEANCSGSNINKYLVSGMLVSEYQAMIKKHFNESDPQFSLTKHLKYDVEHGYVELFKN